MAHLALTSGPAGLLARAGPLAAPAGQPNASTLFCSRALRSLPLGAAPMGCRRHVQTGAWWNFGSKAKKMAEPATASDGPPQATKESQESAPVATSFQAAAHAPAPAAAAASPAPSSPSKGRKGGKGRKGKKGSRGRKAGDAPAATSFVVPAEDPATAESSGSDSEEVEQQQQQLEVAAPAAAAAAPASSNGAAPAAPERQVINLANASLTVNPDGTISISGADAAKVLEALAAVGVVPASSNGASSSNGSSSANGSSSSNGAAMPVLAPPQLPTPPRETSEVEYLTARAVTVQEHFDTALGADDFMQRVEMALYGFGFSGSNSIAMVNLCRDEVTVTLKQKIDAVFGASFSTNGLGGVLTCGTIGMGAGFSHSPVCGTTGKERYVFFSFPHISINSKGEVGPMSRPGRPGQSCACGALIKSWSEIRSQGLTPNCKIPGVHDAVNPEYSILKQRIARRLRHEGETDESVKQLSLTDVTKVAERTISDDLEFLISKTVDVSKADYAVITGVQIHNWAHNFEDDSPNLEFVAPTSAYVVVNGVKTHIDLNAMPPLTPRQIRLLHGGRKDVVCNTGGQSTLREEEAPYAFDSKETRKAQRQRLERYVSLLKEEGLQEFAVAPPPATWQGAIMTSAPARCATADNSTIVDREAASRAALELKEIQEILQQKYKEQQQGAA